MLPLVLTMLVSGCARSLPASIEAMQEQVTPLAQDHAAALAECPSPVCDEVILSGTKFIRGYLAGVGQSADR